MINARTHQQVPCVAAVTAAGALMGLTAAVAAHFLVLDGSRGVVTTASVLMFGMAIAATLMTLAVARYFLDGWARVLPLLAFAAASAWFFSAVAA